MLAEVQADSSSATIEHQLCAQLPVQEPWMHPAQEPTCFCTSGPLEKDLKLLCKANAKYSPGGFSKRAKKMGIEDIANLGAGRRGKLLRSSFQRFFGGKSCH